MHNYVWINSLKVALTSLNIEFYRWKVRKDYNLVPKWFSGIQRPPSMVNSSEIDLKKKASLKQSRKSLQIISPIVSKTNESNTELEDLSTGFSMLNFPEKFINPCNTRDKSE